METEIKEQKQVVLKRFPPGDRWVAVNATQPSHVYPSLTDALEGHYQQTGQTQFYIDARLGTVEVVTETEVEKPVRRFSLYGED
ncbi:hypothetical protein UFOVP449_184 [uncultured Caudovirales phage]|uniref:Uncharacterized protein n=1 Tax=uncultured Caudovirales phage TaxID=2100421 RepID=A0A6J5MB52_9CAUD|nr:hypothetical protein UFOVP449_184 [uncultured Caudovirales phage]